MGSVPVKVDVGIPAYKRPHLLVEAIESVLGQTLGDFRLTVSDNGPGGGEVEDAVGRYLYDPRVRYVATGGVPQHANMTSLIQTGEAPYVALLHDDDVWQPEFLQRHVDFLEAHPECGAVFSNSYEIEEHGRRTRDRVLPLKEGVYSSEQFLSVLYEGNPVAPPTLLVRRSAYAAVGPYFTPDLRRYFDYEMLFRLAARFPVGYLDVRDAGYRLHGGSVTSSSRLFGEEHLQSLDRAEEIVRTELPHFRFDPEARARIRSFYALRASMDVLEEGRPRHAVSHLVTAARLRPQAIVNPRFAVGIVGIVSGPVGRRALQAARGRRDNRQHQRRLSGAGPSGPPSAKRGRRRSR